MTLFQWIGNGRRAVVHEPYRRWTRCGIVEVPTGFETDFASIPRLFWSLIPPLGKYNMAAVVHDYLYRTQRYGLTRKEVDQIFYDLMIEDGVTKLRARTIYAAVRVGAWLAWKGQQ